jgi:hypothetical protein
VVAMPHEMIFRQLERYLGPHTAKTALKVFADKSIGKRPEEITRIDAPKVLQALRPMLRTLIGADQCDVVLTQLTRELSL